MNDLRKEFWATMCEIAEADKDVILITGDLGYSFDKEFKEKYSKQYMNIGCIEQSMIGIACGMALAGKKPYVYSNAIFLLMRAYEQVRDDVCYNNLNVKLIGTGASGFLGFSHNLSPMESEEHLLKYLPNVITYKANDKERLKRALLLEGAMYIRL